MAPFYMYFLEFCLGEEPQTPLYPQNVSYMCITGHLLLNKYLNMKYGVLFDYTKYVTLILMHICVKDMVQVQEV